MEQESPEGSTKGVQPSFQSLHGGQGSDCSDLENGF